MSWTKAPGGVSASVVGGTSLRLSAAGSAARRHWHAEDHPGRRGQRPPAARLTSRSSGAAARRPAASAPVRSGQSVTVDLSQYVTSPLPLPVISVLGVTPVAGSTATATVTHSGSTSS